MVIAATPTDATPVARPRRAARAARSSSPGMRAAWIAFGLGSGYAAVSAYWALGGTGLLGTVGGSLERAGRQGGSVISFVLWAAVAVKLAAAVLPLLAVGGRGHGAWKRTVRVLVWIECAVLVGYGLALTGVGLLVVFGVVPVGADADRWALTWHALLWDPWFLIWGLFVLAGQHAGHSAKSETQP